MKFGHSHLLSLVLFILFAGAGKEVGLGGGFACLYILFFHWDFGDVRMEGLAANAHALAVLDHLKKGGVAYVVAWPKNYPPVRQPLKNRSVVDFRTAGWRGEFLPVREEEVKGRDLKHLLGVALLRAPIMDNAMTGSGITGTLSLARR